MSETNAEDKYEGVRRKSINNTAKTYINGISTFCKTRGFSNEGAYGYLENVLFQLKRKEQKAKDNLIIIAEEITGIEEQIEEILAKIDCEAEEEPAGLKGNK